ncbi:MAG: hypothetical protein ACK5LZ_04730 [Anaerorhabdus sp.]
MKYYNVETIESEEVYLVSHTIELEKNSIVIISNYMGEVVSAKVLEPVCEYTALVSGKEVDKILHVMNLTEWHARKQAKMQKAQLERIMKDKIDVIKNLELLEKYAGKDSDFATLLNEYKQASEVK